MNVTTAHANSAYRTAQVQAVLSRIDAALHGSTNPSLPAATPPYSPFVILIDEASALLPQGHAQPLNEAVPGGGGMPRRMASEQAIGRLLAWFRTSSPHHSAPPEPDAQ
jgi:hypothetical protein